MKYLILLILFSCASYKPRNPGLEASQSAGEKHSELKISALHELDLSHDDYQVFKIYFENASRDWIRLKNVSIKDVKGPEEFHVIRGSDLEVWKKSMLLHDALMRDELAKEKKPVPPASIRKKMKDLDTSLYAEGSYVLPGQLQTERWLVLQLPPNTLKGILVLNLVFADNSASTFEVQFNEEKVK